MTKIGIIVFLMAVLLGPIYTVDGYSNVSNAISELGAQNTSNNYIMIMGFLFVGLGIVIDGVKNYSHSSLPFIVFGACVALAGIFPHKPISEVIDYNMLAHETHKILATIAGVAITIGFIWQGVLFKKSAGKIPCYYLAAVCTGFPLLMLYVPEYQGIIQRFMYAQVFLWLWYYFPRAIVTNKHG